jgi:tyrosyl-DNA phosphodiesterase 1
VAPSDYQTAVPGSSTFLSERAQLEKERRERQKRLRPEAILDNNDLDDESDEDAVVRDPPAKRQHLSSSSRVRTVNPSTRPTSSSSTASTSANMATIDRVFWDGEFRQTATRHAEPRKDGRPTFRITEVLGPVSLKFNCLFCVSHSVIRKTIYHSPSCLHTHWTSHGYMNSLIVPSP